MTSIRKEVEEQESNSSDQSNTKIQVKIPPSFHMRVGLISLRFIEQCVSGGETLSYVLRTQAEQIISTGLQQLERHFTSPVEYDNFAFLSGISTRDKDKEKEKKKKNLSNHPLYNRCGSAAMQNIPPLVFESRFESGNLQKAVRVGPTDYNLELMPDTNSKNNMHTQWFFFSVEKAQPFVKYRFNIVNISKGSNLYNEGMRILVYSEKEAAKSGVGWTRSGENICLYSNSHNRLNTRRAALGRFSNYGTLSFCYTFNHISDRCFFAHSYPYSYSDLQNYISELISNPRTSSFVSHNVLCKTLGGKNCDLLTITSNSNEYSREKRKAIVLTSRVHPGESPSSWIMKGFIDFLTGSSMDAQILREHFVFKVVPMLNPDGVIFGNTRCSLSGHDLNRNWSNPDRKSSPTIYYAKKMIQKFAKEHSELTLYVDIHAHSKKKNVFMFGCENTSNPLVDLIFPRLLARNSLVFSFSDCTCKVEKSKESTGRVVFAKELDVINSYTLETSFCGSNFGAFNNFHFGISHLNSIGVALCDTILDFCDPDQTKVQTILRELETVCLSPKSTSSHLEKKRFLPQAKSQEKKNDTHFTGASNINRTDRTGDKKKVVRSRRNTTGDSFVSGRESKNISRRNSTFVPKFVRLRFA